MKFRSVNEFETFSFKDAVLLSMKMGEDVLELEIEGAITNADNSQNARYQDMYIVMMQLKLKNFKMDRFVEQGFKQYDMEGKLLKTVPDRALDENQIKYISSKVNGCYIFNMGKQKDSDLYELVFDMEPDTDDEFEKTYEVDFTFEGSTAEWDRYSGPVEK